MRIQEKLTYTNERGESIVFSPSSSYHVNFKDVTGLSAFATRFTLQTVWGKTAIRI